LRNRFCRPLTSLKIDAVSDVFSLPTKDLSRQLYMGADLVRGELDVSSRSEIGSASQLCVVTEFFLIKGRMHPHPSPLALRRIGGIGIRGAWRSWRQVARTLAKEKEHNWSSARKGL
jgi:hypothetical protein